MTDFDICPAPGPSHISASDRIDGDDMQGEIGLRLRALYEAIVAEQVPDRFRTLLESLDCSNDKRI